MSLLLPRLDTALLHCTGWLVPLAARQDWLRTWQAELWHNRHRRGGSPVPGCTRALAFGLVRDALWLRTEQCRLALEGTVSLCLAQLAALVFVAVLLALGLYGSPHATLLALAAPFQRFLVASPLVLFVALATASRRPVEPDAAVHPRMQRRLFFAAKALLLLVITFLLSADVCAPIHDWLPNTSEILQILLFVVFALAGLRWALADQDQRCKQCLRVLAAPSRVGRPSHNLLEWNGTELLCRRGHGLLSVPEMETSWCQSSRWVRTWDQTASP